MTLLARLVVLVACLLATQDFAQDRADTAQADTAKGDAAKSDAPANDPSKPLDLEKIEIGSVGTLDHPATVIAVIDEWNCGLTMRRGDATVAVRLINYPTAGLRKWDPTTIRGTRFICIDSRMIETAKNRMPVFTIVAVPDEKELPLLKKIAAANKAG